MSATAALNPEQERGWKARPGFSGASKEGEFPGLYKTKHRESAQHGVCV